MPYKNLFGGLSDAKNTPQGGVFASDTPPPR